jgi:hypothetical protein
VNLHTGQRDHAAVPLGEDVLDRCERLLGPAHVETWRARNNLGATHLLARRPVRAARIPEEVHADRERVLGDDHPATQDTRDLLTMARQNMTACSGTSDAGHPRPWP